MLASVVALVGVEEPSQLVPISMRVPVPGFCSMVGGGRYLPSAIHWKRARVWGCGCVFATFSSCFWSDARNRSLTGSWPRSGEAPVSGRGFLMPRTPSDWPRSFPGFPRPSDQASGQTCRDTSHSAYRLARTRRIRAYGKSDVRRSCQMLQSYGA